MIGGRAEAAAGEAAARGGSGIATVFAASFRILAALLALRSARSLSLIKSAECQNGPIHILNYNAYRYHLQGELVLHGMISDCESE